MTEDRSAEPFGAGDPATGREVVADGSMTLWQAGQRDTDRIERLLSANELPQEGVRASPESFFLATVGTDLVGVGGIERHGQHGLVRSVVVPESHRGQGYGTRLVELLEARAREEGVERLYLLTTTAAAFFRRHGYEDTRRECVPPEIRQTGEFAELCPASATRMEKSLR